MSTYGLQISTRNIRKLNIWKIARNTVNVFIIPCRINRFFYSSIDVQETLFINSPRTHSQNLQNKTGVYGIFSMLLSDEESTLSVKWQPCFNTLSIPESKLNHYPCKRHTITNRLFFDSITPSVSKHFPMNTK